MRTTLGVVLLVVACALPGLAAQTITRSLTWTQGDAPTVAAAQALTYRLQVDALPTTWLLAQTCTLTGTVVSCSAPLPVIPALSLAGMHTITLSVDNGFSTASATLSGTQLLGPSSFKIVTTVTVGP